jgi:hypothetical protein
MASLRVPDSIRDSLHHVSGGASGVWSSVCASHRQPNSSTGVATKHQPGGAWSRLIKKATPGPGLEVLKIEGSWKDAMRKLISKKSPVGGWPKD